MPTVNVGTPDPNYRPALNLFVGSACNDNNAATINDAVNANCECVGTPDPNLCADWQAFVGSACDDGNNETENDTIDKDCNCLNSCSKNENLVLANIIMPESGDVKINFRNPCHTRCICYFLYQKPMGKHCR